ncbi:MAG: exosortase A [Gammaproteobacteria bacterium]|nr:exosortase A [Gammaproteobacteria bacterium]
MYFSTYLSMAQVWWRSETFSHGFLIFPIAAWLIWRNRAELARLPLAPDLRALVPLLALVLGWAVARSVDVLVVEQYAVVVMLPVLVWLCLGLRAVWALAFPLAFILLAVPVGEFLIYPMMEFTAAFTVNAVRLTGIPVYWDGMFFTLPSGTWNIVEGCSGVRYIIASVTLGVLYAYLTYYSYWRRAAFILAACLVPVIANGMRAFIIVMLGHFSGMKIATGVDHLVYGWVWFGIVMFFLFWAGGFFRDDEPMSGWVRTFIRPPWVRIHRTPPVGPDSSGHPLRPWYLVAATGIALLALGPLWVAWIDARPHTENFRIHEPAAAGSWSATPAFTDWKPHYVNPADERQSSYSDGTHALGVYLAYYGHQEQDAELINSQNVMIEQKHPIWRQPMQGTREVRVGDATIPLIESRLESDQQRLLVWHWMRVAGKDVNNPYVGKVYEALGRLGGGGRDGFGIVVYAPYTDDPGVARERMQAFLETMLPSLNDAMRVELP